ncbi:MAG: ParA family protein [Bdellovibrionales bacterium]
MSENPSARILALANQKGGVGKTTVCFNLATALTRAGHKVLLIDNDPQANLTAYTGVVVEPSTLTLDQVYLARDKRVLSLHDLSQVSAKLYLLPSDAALAGVEYYLVSRAARESVLKAALEGLRKEFDFILIDNPPSLNLLTLNGLMAAHGVLVPLQADFFSLEGLSQLEATIRDLKRWNENLEIVGIIRNVFDQRRRLNQDVSKLLAEKFGSLLFETKIHNSVKVAESAGFGKSIFQYAPSSKSSAEFAELAEELKIKLERMSYV